MGRVYLSKKLRYEILKRDGFRCQSCGRGTKDHVKLHIDHTIPVAEGGTNHPDNLQTLCNHCNLGKGATLPSDNSYLKKYYPHPVSQQNNTSENRQVRQSTNTVAVNAIEQTSVWGILFSTFIVFWTIFCFGGFFKNILSFHLSVAFLGWGTAWFVGLLIVSIVVPVSGCFNQIKSPTVRKNTLLALLVLLLILLFIFTALILWGFSGSQTKVLVLEQPKPILNIPNPEPRKDDVPPKSVIITPSWKIIKHDGMFPFSADIELIEGTSNYTNFIKRRKK